MEEAYSNLNNAYLQIKGMIVVEGFYALVAGFVITTFVFKLAGIIKEMVHEGKGFNAKQFYELGREYILCIALIRIMPVLLDTLETVLAYAADRLMESLAAVLGLAAIVYGADLLVDGAVGIAKALGVSEEIIGLTVIAVGTSLPELATSCVAAWRKQSDLAVGNVLGSNIWNIVFIMGAAAAVTDVEVPAQFVRYDMWVMLAATLLLLLPVWRCAYIGRIYGALFVICYLAYLTSQVLIARGLF